MIEDTLAEVSEILIYIAENNTVPRNVRDSATESEYILNDLNEDLTVRISTVIGKLDAMSNDPNIPVHARTLVWELLSKLEAI